MSYIPSSAMPHAGPSTSEGGVSGSATTATSSDTEASPRGRAGRMADSARANPGKTAAGAALVAGVLAAAAIPIVRARGKSGEGKKSGGASSGKKTTKS